MTKVEPKWTGNYTNRKGPNGTEIRFTGHWWLIRDADGLLISKHDSRAYALKKARKMDSMRTRTVE